MTGKVERVRREIAAAYLVARREADEAARVEEESEPDALLSIERAAALGLADGLLLALEVLDGVTGRPV